MCFVRALEEPAIDFLRHNCSVAMSFLEIVAIMNREYDPQTIQLTVQPEIETLFIDGFLVKSEVSLPESGLERGVVFTTASHNFDLSLIPRPLALFISGPLTWYKTTALCSFALHRENSQRIQITRSCKKPHVLTSSLPSDHFTTKRTPR